MPKGLADRFPRPVRRLAGPGPRFAVPAKRLEAFVLGCCHHGGGGHAVARAAEARSAGGAAQRRGRAARLQGGKRRQGAGLGGDPAVEGRFWF